MHFLTNLTGVDSILNIIVLASGLLSSITFFSLYFTKLRSRQLLNFIPNIWTSLGILGTFLALVISLSKIENADIDSIIKLIEEIAPAFTTSIIGVTGAVLTSIIIKIIYAVEEQTENDKYIKEVKGNISPEMLLSRINGSMQTNNRLIEKLILEQQKQPDLIQLFLDEHIDKLENMYKEVIDSNKKYAQEITCEFLKNIHKIADESVRTIALSIRNQVIHETKEFSGQLIKNIQDFETGLSKNASESYCELFSKTQETMSEFTIKMETVLANNMNLYKGINSESNAMIEKASNSMVISAQKYQDITSQLDRLLPALQTSVQNSEKKLKHFKDTNGKLQQLLDTTEEVYLKNQQLRNELMQWKRVHKEVNISVESGVKQCPDCNIENSIQANFCKKCSFNFWNYDKDTENTKYSQLLNNAQGDIEQLITYNKTLKNIIDDINIISTSTSVALEKHHSIANKFDTALPIIQNSSENVAKELKEMTSYLRSIVGKIEKKGLDHKEREDTKEKKRKFSFWG